jgi:4-hydroxy-3-methylbut-2-enyl diphosphate reductase
MFLVQTPEDVEKLSVSKPEDIAFVTQTTLSVDDTALVIDALRKRFPTILGPKKDDICYATQNRQDAVRELAKRCDLILVVGSLTSSNSNRLKELAEKNGTSAYLVDGPEDIDSNWLVGRNAIGITAGASAPEVLVQRVIDKLKNLGGISVHELQGRDEHMVFPLPRALREHPPKTRTHDPHQQS